MSDTTRVQRWREAKRQHGLKGLTVWLDEGEDLRLRVLAGQWRISPSEMLQQAWAAFQPGQPSSIGNSTDTSQLRQLIREELAALRGIESPDTDTVTDTFTVMVTETPGEGAAVV